MEINFRSLIFQLGINDRYGYEVTKAIVNICNLEKNFET